jgi:MFS family permease
MGGIIADRFSNDAAFLTGALLTFVGALIAILTIPQIRTRLHGRAASGPVGIRAWLVALAALPEFPILASAWGFNTLVFFTVQGVLLATLVILVQQRGFHLLDMAAQGTAGLVMAALMGCSSIAALALGRGIDRLRLRSSLLLPSIAGVALGFAVIGLAHDLAGTFAGAILVGIFFNGINLPMLALLGDISRPEHYGRITGMYQLFGDLGGSLGPILGVEAGLRYGLGWTYLAMAALLALSGFAALWVWRREHRMRLEPG